MILQLIEFIIKKRGVAVRPLWLCVTASALCSCSPRAAEVRFKVDVTIDDNGQERRQSAVWSTTISRPLIQLTDSYVRRWDIESIPIHLSDGSWLFFLPAGRSTFWPEYYYEKYILRWRGVSDRIEITRRAARKVGWRFRINCSYHPENFPRWPSKERCPPTMIANNLADPESFKEFDLAQFPQADGHRVRLKSIVVTVTNAPATQRLYAMMPWLRELQRSKSINEKLRSSQQDLADLSRFAELKIKN